MARKIRARRSYKEWMQRYSAVSFILEGRVSEPHMAVKDVLRYFHDRIDMMHGYTYAHNSGSSKESLEQMIADIEKIGPIPARVS